MIDYENEAAEVRARINLLLKEKGITQNAVAAGDSATQSRLNSQLRHGKRITVDTVIGQQNVLSENFVRDMLAEKDKQIQTLLQIMAK